MDKWKIEKWKDVLKIVNGKNQAKVIEKDGKYPIYGSGGIMAYANDYLCSENTTIIGRKGSINNPIYVETKFWNVDTAFGICAGSNLIPKYLHYFCLSYDFTKHNKSTTLPSLTKSDLLEIEIPLPSLPIQKQIVSKLDTLFEKADQSIQLLEENLKHSQALLLSVLDEEFSRLKCNQIPIGSLLEKTNNVNPITEFQNDEFTYIDITSINNSDYEIENPKILKGKEAPSRAKKVVTIGDIVFATTRPNLKNIAIVNKVYNNPIASTGFCVLRTKKSKLLNEYLFHYLTSHKVQELIEPFIKGAQYPAISDKDLLSIAIPIPDSIDEQQKIVSRIKLVTDKTNDVIKEIQNKLQNLKALKSSLLDQAFKGEL